MRIFRIVIAFVVTFGSAFGQNQLGAPAIYSKTNGTISPSTVWIDSSQFASGDICLDIQSAIHSLPTSDLFGGVVVDARNYPSALSTSTLTCSVNPFATQTNPLQLVFGGATGGSAGVGGGILLLPGATISVSVPWLVPGNWSVYGEGAGATVLVAGFTSVPVQNGGFSTTNGSITVTNTTSTWGTGNIGLVFLACPNGASVCTPRLWHWR